MSDIQNGQLQAEGQTAEPMPSSEQPAEDAQEAVQETPEQVKARTAEQFEKLTAKNRELSEKLKAYEGSKPSPSSVLDELRPNVDAVPQVPAPLPGSLIDEGGFVDANLLNSTLSASQKNAEEARRIALQTQQEIQRFQESQVVQAVHKDYPEIDPNNQGEFNPEAYDFVKNELVGQLMKGQPQDLSAAAAKARKLFSGKQPTPVEPRKETISQRDQASATTGTSHSAPQAIDQSDLVARTYKGDKDAIYKRLQASGN